MITAYGIMELSELLVTGNIKAAQPPPPFEFRACEDPLRHRKKKGLLGLCPVLAREMGVSLEETR